MHSAFFRQCLQDIDVAGIRKVWAHISPHLPQPETDDDALIALHMARTQSDAMTLKERAYSHRWLSDIGMPSQLPDNLKPSAERIYPKVVEAVGIANANMQKDDGLRPLREAVQKGMMDAVEDCFANNDRDPALVTKRMFEARSTVRKQMLGRLFAPDPS